MVQTHCDVFSWMIGFCIAWITIDFLQYIYFEEDVLSDSDDEYIELEYGESLAVQSDWEDS